jgi:endonuclease/exonuclease/phosphatase family metal-dependent hydrolase
MAERAPDILALQEVENAGVIQDLAEGDLSKYGYNWTFFANNPGASLGIGLLSRFPLSDARVHSVTCNGETSPRPIVEVRVKPGNAPLVLFVCHWKSKVGGDGATESLRRSSARVILRRLQEIREEAPDMPVIVMGDLNENYDEFYRRASSVVSALLPDDPQAAELSGLGADREVTGPDSPADFLVISRVKPPEAEYFTTQAMALYSPWGNELLRGSYSYKNEWETIDHFLLTGSLFDQTGWDFETCAVLDKAPFINAKGVPNAYIPRTGNGLSDHLPLLLTLTRY